MNRQFPALRGVAIFLVVINHSITLGLAAARDAGLAVPTWEKYLLIALKEFGIAAVPIFLFLAACFFAYGAQGKSIKQGYRLVFQGLLYIFIPYVLWSLAFYGLEVLLGTSVFSVSAALRNLLVGYPFNFVPILVFFYLLAPLLVRAEQKYPLLVTGLFLFYQLILINLLQPGWLGFSFPGWMSFLAVPVLKLPLAVWGVFYPLGLAYSLHAPQWTPGLTRWRWLLLGVFVLLYLAAWATQVSLLAVPLAEVFAPLPLMLLLPLIQRKAIPLVSWFETLGKRSYGLYLTNLLVITLLVALVKSRAPWLLQIQSALAILLAAITLSSVPAAMQWIERKGGRQVYRYLFG